MISAVVLAAGASTRFGSPKQAVLLEPVLERVHGSAAIADVVILGDGPKLDPRAVDRVVAAWREEGTERVAATYGGVRLHPLLLARNVWDEVPDEGLRGLPAQLVPCDDLEPPGDVDFADDLSR